MTTPNPQPNRFAGSCYTCGAKVPAGAGTWSPDRRAQHAPGQCKTTTKTYRDTISRAIHDAHYEDRGRTWAAAGYALDVPQYAYSPTVITGHGLRALLGGERERDRGKMPEQIGLEVYRNGGLIAKHPRPRGRSATAPSGLRVQAGDVYAGYMADVVAVIGLLEQAREA